VCDNVDRNVAEPLIVGIGVCAQPAQRNGCAYAQLADDHRGGLVDFGKLKPGLPGHAIGAARRPMPPLSIADDT
jgi:hypothetical protein